jgi:hypothetical protein
VRKICFKKSSHLKLLFLYVTCGSVKGCLGWGSWIYRCRDRVYTDKKKTKFSSYKEIQVGSGAKSYMRRKGFQIWGNAQIFSPYMRRSLVIYDFAPDPSECHNIWGKFSFLFYQCTLYYTCRGWRSYSAKCCKTRRCLKEMSCRYIAEYFTDKTNMRVIKTIKPPASWLEAGRQVYFKTRYPVACLYGQKEIKMFFFVCPTSLSEMNHRRIFLRWKIRQAVFRVLLKDSNKTF